MTDSVFRTGKNYYLQMFLEECKYVISKKKKLPEYITDNFFLILMKKILMKTNVTIFKVTHMISSDFKSF